jgi:hypothetical protein
MEGMLILMGLLAAGIVFDLAAWRWAADSTDALPDSDRHKTV